MALRLPEPRRPSPSRRQSSTDIRELITVGIASFLLVVFTLRLILRLVEIEPWITTWRLVAFVTYPVVRPLKLIDTFQQTLVAGVTIADLASFVLVGIVVLYLIASLTVQRSR